MGRIITVATALALVAVLLSAGVYALTRPDRRLEVQANVKLFDALGGPDSSQFARVLGPRDFSFPADHGPHPDYGVEWWYFTGNLESTDGRHFGYELTLFRIGLSPQQPERASNWATSQLYMGHLALTDVASNKFYSFQRFSRGALGLAGASLGTDQTWNIWLEDWRIDGKGSTTPMVHLSAAEDTIAIDLQLVSGKPLVLQGDQGFSQKSAGPGNASQYYSITRMPTSGTLTVGDAHIPVTGNSWMDREWSTSSLDENQMGWDWFALQLSDGGDLMFYQLRDKDGGIDQFSAGTLVLADGTTRRLSASDVGIQTLDQWQSPLGGTYPIKWRVRIPSESIDIEITPYIKDQELDVSVRYWEGAVQITGTADGQPISGNGYVEMTGYSSGIGGRS